MPLNLPNMYPDIPKEMFPTKPTGWQAGILGGIQGLNQGMDKYAQMKKLQQDMALNKLEQQLKQQKLEMDPEKFKLEKQYKEALIEQAKELGEKRKADIEQMKQVDDYLYKATGGKFGKPLSQTIEIQTTGTNRDTDNTLTKSPSAFSQSDISQPYTSTGPSSTASPNAPYNGFNNYLADSLVSHRLGLPKIEIVDVDGVKTAMSPISGPIPLIKGNSDWQKALIKEDAKIYGQWQEQLSSEQDMRRTLDSIKNIIKSPELMSMKQNPQYFGKDILWFKRFGEKGQQDAVGALYTNTGTLYSDMASRFKGQFRVGEQALIKEMKPDPEDTLYTLIGKSRTLQALNEIKIKEKELASKLVRTGKYSPAEALSKSYKMINGEKITERIKKEYYDYIKENEAKVKAYTLKTMPNESVKDIADRKLSYE